MTDHHVLRVFTDDEGRFGNPLGVFLDGAAVPRERRQPIATELGFSETVFVLDRAAARVEIYTPTSELPFAGHPLVGTAWLLGDASVLRPPAGEVETWTDHGWRWIRGRPEWAPPFQFRQYDSPAEIDALTPPTAEPLASGESAGGTGGHLSSWAWIDERAGTVRVRVFVPEIGIAEDEATGAAAVRMAALLGREIEIRQGRGSVLHARPGPDGTCEVGGRVVLDERP